MRNTGGVLLLIGAIGFFYCSSQLSSQTPVAEGASLEEYLRTEVGRLELGRYLAASMALVGLLLAVFPKGR